MTTTASGAAEPTLAPGVPFDERSGLRHAGADDPAERPQPATLAVMVHVLGIVGLLAASLPIGLLLLRLAPMLGIVGVLAVQGLALLWFLWLLHATPGRREALDDEEALAQQALVIPARAPARARAPRSRDDRTVVPILNGLRPAALRG